MTDTTQQPIGERDLQTEVGTGANGYLFAQRIRDGIRVSLDNGSAMWLEPAEALTLASDLIAAARRALRWHDEHDREA